MKQLLNVVFAFGLIIGSIAIVNAAEYTKGFVKKINMKTGKVTIRHEELKNLEMPAMTMVFRTANKDILESLKQGEDIEFIAERVKGKLTVIEVK